MILGEEQISRTAIQIIDKMGIKEIALTLILTTFFLFIVLKVIK